MSVTRRGATVVVLMIAAVTMSASVAEAQFRRRPRIEPPRPLPPAALPSQLPAPHLELAGDPGRTHHLSKRHNPQPAAALLVDARNTGLSHFEGPARGEILWVSRIDASVLAAPAIDAMGYTYWSTRGDGVSVLDTDGNLVKKVAEGTVSNSVPALGSDGSIYTADKNGDIRRYDVDGQIVWRQPLQRETVSSPLLDEAGARLFISADDHTFALDTATGELIFEFDSGTDLYNSSPALGPDGWLRFTNWGGLIIGVDKRGVLRFRYRLVNTGRISPPTLGPFGVLYAATGGGRLVAISPHGRKLWETRMPGSVVSFLAMMPDGRLVVPVTGFGLQVVTPQGALSWSHEMIGERMGYTVSVSASGNVYYNTARGHIGALDADGRQLFSVETEYDFALGPVIAPPVRGTPRAYIGSAAGDILCLQ